MHLADALVYLFVCLSVSVLAFLCQYDYVQWLQLLLLLSVQCYAMHGYKFTCVCVCLCVRHTFCQLAYRSDPLTDFYS